MGADYLVRCVMLSTVITSIVTVKSVHHQTDVLQNNSSQSVNSMPARGWNFVTNQQNNSINHSTLSLNNTTIISLPTNPTYLTNGQESIVPVSNTTTDTGREGDSALNSDTNTLPTRQHPGGGGTKVERSAEVLERTFVTALEGSKTALLCDVLRPFNDTIDLILWFRGASEEALYSIDARRSASMRGAKHFQGTEELGARAYIDLSTVPTRLIIESVKAEDGGEYKCRVDFRKSRSEYRAVVLEVFVPPKEVIIMDEYGQRLSDPVGPFNEDSHLSLICEAEGGNPRPLLHWYRDGSQLIDDTWSVTAQGIIRNELIVPKLSRRDQSSKLTCHVLVNASSSSLNLAGSDMTASTTSATEFVQNSSLLLLKSVHASITLELNLRPLDVRITTVPRPITLGNESILKCESSGSKPPALLSWWKGAHRLEGALEEISSDENRTLSTLHFKPEISDHGKVLTCRADHSALPDSALEDSWMLNVLYPPQLSVSLGSSSLGGHYGSDQILEGSNVSLECHVDANPKITKTTWLFNDKTIESFLNGERYVQSGTSLFIKNINKDLAGLFRCEASNEQGTSHSEDIEIAVQFAPSCRSNQRYLYGVTLRETVQISCSVDANPPEEVHFRWSFNSSYESITLKSHEQLADDPLTSVVHYTPMTKYSYGKLHCWASNALGEQREPCSFEVIPATVPEPLHDCAVSSHNNSETVALSTSSPTSSPSSNEVTLGSLLITCEPGADGGLDQVFHLELYQADEQGRLWTNESTLPGARARFEVKNLPISTTFVLLLYASNSRGRSKYTTLQASTLISGARGSEFLKFTSDFAIKPVMYILVTVIVSLVIVAMVIMFVSKVRSNITKPKGRHEMDSFTGDNDVVGERLTVSMSKDSLERHSLDILQLDDHRMAPPSHAYFDNSSLITGNLEYKYHQSPLLGRLQSHVLVEPSPLGLASTSSLDSGPPMYHNIYGQTHTSWSQAPLSNTPTTATTVSLSGAVNSMFTDATHSSANHPQSSERPDGSDILLMDVSGAYYTGSPAHLIGISAQSANNEIASTLDEHSGQLFCQNVAASGYGIGNFAAANNNLYKEIPVLSTNSTPVRVIPVSPSDLSTPV